MIDYDNLRTTVVTGLKKYLNCLVIRSNQNAEPPPYPYVSYTVTTPMTANNGTYGEYEDGKARKPVACIWSITVQSDDDLECVTLVNKAREWLDYVGTVYLNDNNVIVQSVGVITNRDNVLTVEYEYRKGFDVVFWLFDEVDIPNKETIETLTIEEDMFSKLENRLDGVEKHEFTTDSTDGNDTIIAALEKRLSGEE